MERIRIGIVVGFVLMAEAASAVQGYDRPADTRSARSMVLARRGMAATSHPLASQAAIAILQRGGNAFDAAVAAAAVLNVVEPMSTGIGGDMFVLAWPAAERRLVGLNGSGRSAATATVEAYRALGLKRVPTYGPHAVTVPGAFHGWATLIEKYGTLPMATLLEPAIGLAEEGFAVTEVIAADWRGALQHKDNPEFARVYLIRDGDGWRTPRVGEIFRQPDLARTLRTLARGGKDAFTRGEIGRAIADYLQTQGSLLRREDFERHESTWVEPISTEFQGYVLHELPPNGQGIVALEMLNILSGYDLKALGHNSAEYLHRFIEAKKLAFADRDAFVTDPARRAPPIETLVSKEYAARVRARIDPDRAQAFPKPTLDPGTDTVYLCVADGRGNVVSFINSLFHGFGSGLVVPGTGICLQNRGSSFSLEPDHRNRIEPSKRPLHTIIPAMVTRDGAPWFCYGVMGGDMQPQGHVQVLLNLIVFGMTPQEAGEAPRVREADGVVGVERGIPVSVREALARKGHRVREGTGGFGGFQGILIDRANGVLYGASDPRKDGCALGY
jgi:gamma-glutamyltranspeptidase/glutathione hydrolase